jgi:hypothetical protein
MFNKGRMLPLLTALGAFLMTADCTTPVPDWGTRSSYIVVADNTDTLVNNAKHLYVVDDTGGIIASIAPLVDSMTGIASPTFVDGTKQIAFLSSDLPTDPATLHVIDRTGRKLYHYDGLFPIQLDGSPTEPLLAFTYNSTSKRVLLMQTDDSKANPYNLFKQNTPKVFCPSVGDSLELLQAFQPSFSPSGDEIAFINIGTYMTGAGPMDRTDIAVSNKDGTNYHLVTGVAVDADSLPKSTWLDLFWSSDGEWIFVVEGTSHPAMLYEIRVSDGTIYLLYRDFFQSYSYVRPSPTGDTLLFGTRPRNADLYVVGYSIQNNHPELEAAISKRLTNTRYFDQPDWGPGGE